MMWMFIGAVVLLVVWGAWSLSYLRKDFTKRDAPSDDD